MRWINIEPQEEKSAPGVRVVADAANERVWMHGKWLDLADHHAVAWIDAKAEFITQTGRRLLLGMFPAWSVRGKGTSIAIMFDIGQFVSGAIIIGKKRFLIY